MDRFVVFGVAALLRAISMVAELYADRLFQLLRNGAGQGLDLLRDLQEFGRWLVSYFADQLYGRAPQRADLDEEELEPAWQPGLFAR